MARAITRGTWAAVLAAVLAAGCRGVPEAGPPAEAQAEPAAAAAQDEAAAAYRSLVDSLPRQADGTIVLDLPHCLKLAFARNRGLTSDRLSDFSTQIALLSQRAAFLPTLTASGSHSDNSSDSRSGTLTLSKDTPWGTGFSASFSESWDHGSRDASASLSISQPLLAGFGRSSAGNALANAEIGALISRADLELAAQYLAYSVTASYYSATGQVELVKVSRRAVERSRAFLSRTKTFKDVGRKTVLDVSNSEIQLAEREISLASSERALADALDDLKDALDLDPDLKIALKPLAMELEESDTDEVKQSIVIEPPDPEEGAAGAVKLKRIDKKAPGGPREEVLSIFESVELEYEPLLAEALGSRLEVRNSQWRLQQAQLSLAMRRNEARPDLDLSLSYTMSSTDDHFSDAVAFGGGDDTWVVGLTYTFPWGKVSDRVSLKQAEATVMQRELDLQGSVVSVKLQIREMLRLLHNTEQNIFALAMKMKGAFKALEAAKILVEHGKADNFQILEAEDDLLSAQTGFIQAFLNYRTQLARLDQRLGRRTGMIDTGLLDGSVRPGRAVTLRDEPGVTATGPGADGQ